MMNLHRRCQSLVCMGLHITIAMASSTIDSVVYPPIKSPMPASLPPMKKFLSTPNGNAGHRSLAFTTRHSFRHYNRVNRNSIVSLPRFVPSQYSTSDDHEILTPETYANSNMAKRQVKDIITSKALEAFDSTDFAHEPHLSPELEDAETAYEVALIASAAHELADAAEKENRQSKAAMLERERELEWIEEHGDGDSIYGNGGAAAMTVEAFERSLLVAEKELKWLEKNGDYNVAAAMKSEAFQRSLLAAQIANNNSQRTVKIQQQEKFQRSLLSAKHRQQEEFQRSLLSARIANDVKVKETIFVDVEQPRKEEWLGSEVRAASMGGQECLSFDVASAAASSAAAHALAEAEAEENYLVAVEDEKNGDDAGPMAAASMVVDATERMILGEDIAYLSSSPESSSTQIVSKEDEQKKEQQPVENDGILDVQTQLSVQQEVLSEVDQWREEYVREICSHVQQKGVEQTKEKLALKNGGGGSGDLAAVDGDNAVLGSIDAAGSSSAKELAARHANSENSDGAMKKALQRGFIRRMRQRKSLLVAALAVVIGRRLFLALSGNALRLI
mmetsp:Transcript_36611/g.76823  ORF Transcript_36611/g.76823 Transcript_36611/m.76823 type:complete len:561 (-) Transcript_36611:53-1735(-)